LNGEHKRPEEGRELLVRLRNAPPDDAEFREHACGVGIKVWEKSGYEFVIIRETFGCSGGPTIPTLDVDKLLNAAISHSTPGIFPRHFSSPPMARMIFHCSGVTGWMERRLRLTSCMSDSSGFSFISSSVTGRGSGFL
jgi:hypothetical protein